MRKSMKKKSLDRVTANSCYVMEEFNALFVDTNWIKWGDNRHHLSKSVDAFVHFKCYYENITVLYHVTFFGGHSVCVAISISVIVNRFLVS